MILVFISFALWFKYCHGMDLVAIKAGDGKCLDIDHNRQENGVALQTWECNGGVSQKFVYVIDGNKRQIKTSEGKCLDVHGPDFYAGQNGAKVQLWECNGGANQQWDIDEPYIKAGNGKCLNLHGPDFGKNGGKVQIWDCHDNERWDYQGLVVEPQSSSKPGCRKIRHQQIILGYAYDGKEGQSAPDSLSKTLSDCNGRFQNDDQRFGAQVTEVFVLNEYIVENDDSQCSLMAYCRESEGGGWSIPLYQGCNRESVSAQGIPHYHCKMYINADCTLNADQTPSMISLDDYPLAYCKKICYLMSQQTATTSCGLIDGEINPVYYEPFDVYINLSQTSLAVIGCIMVLLLIINMMLLYNNCCNGGKQHRYNKVIYAADSETDAV